MKNRKKLMKNIIKIFVILVLILIFINTNCFAKINTSEISIDPKYEEDFADAGNKILGIVEVVAIIISVIALMIIGIKYMTGSIEEKADYKKTLPYYLIGIVLAGGIIPIMKLIYSFTEEIFK